MSLGPVQISAARAALWAHQQHVAGGNNSIDIQISDLIADLMYLVHVDEDGDEDGRPLDPYNVAEHGIYDFTEDLAEMEKG